MTAGRERVPKHKRRFGSYVMLVLAGERLIGRMCRGWTANGGELVVVRRRRFGSLRGPGGIRRILSTGESAGRSRRAQAR